MKICPFCAEEIQDAAIKCKHCFEFLDGSGRSDRVVAQPEKLVTPWYARTSFIVLTFCTVPPFALPLIWMHPRLNLVWKIILTLLILGASWVVYYACTMLAHSLDEANRMMNEMRF